MHSLVNPGFKNAQRHHINMIKKSGVQQHDDNPTKDKNWIRNSMQTALLE